MTEVVLDSGEAPVPKLNSNASVLANLREEIDTYLEGLQQFSSLEPGEIFQRLSAWTARATELKIQLSRSDAHTGKVFINKELEPFLDECERQFRYHSRRQATMQFELETAGKL